MKFLVTGYSGQLGYDIVRELEKKGYNDIFHPDYTSMDITNEIEVNNIIMSYKPNVIFHCAAYTAVDKAESDKEKCYDVNVNGTANITKYAKEVGAKVIYISTDYVFDGSKEGYYEVDDKICPIDYYGYTKELGEEKVKEYDNHIIVRISWVFGINGNNFIKKMLQLAKTRNEVNVVGDQIGSPTYTKDLSKLLVDMSLSDKTGTYHATNDGVCTWKEFASYIFESNGINMKVNEVLTKDYPTAAKRPHNSKMSKKKLIQDGFQVLPHWKDAVDRYNKELKEQRKGEE